MKSVIILLIIIILYLIFYNKDYFTNRKKVCVIICGFAPRSFKYVYTSIQKNIIHILKTVYDVDTFHYSLLSKKEKIESNRPGEDGFKIDNNDVNLLKVDVLETEYQEDINLTTYIDTGYGDKEDYELNMLRGVYSEYKAIKLFPIKNYDTCIMVWSDALILKPINLKHVENTINDKNLLYTTEYNKFGGLANNFYISSPNTLEKICSRSEIYSEYFKHIPSKLSKILHLKVQTKNAERFVMYTVNKHGIKNKDTDMFYLKIRAHKKSNHYINLIDNYNIPNSDYYKKKF